jgi:uncharacterized OB-fold protein
MIENAPLPFTDDPLDREFWIAARQRRLVVQSCAACGEMRFPPRPMCPQCQAEDVAWQPVSGEAAVWSFAVPAPPLLPAFEALAPYVTIIGALAENPGIRMAGLAVNADGDATGITAADIAIGQPIHIDFLDASEDCTLPCWRLGPKASAA